MIHRAAHHEAAHALVGHVLGVPVVHVLVREDGSGECRYDYGQIDTPNEYGLLIWRLLVDLMCSYAGQIVTESNAGFRSFASSQDFKSTIPTTNLLGESIKGQRLIAAGSRTTRAIIKGLWPAINALAVELSEHWRLDGEYLQQRLVDLVGPRPPLH